jgi:hypothetical protein
MKRPTVCASGGWGEPANETELTISLNNAIPVMLTHPSGRLRPGVLWRGIGLRDAVLARFRVVRLVVQNQPYQLSLPLSSYPSRLSRKNLIALFMKEQHVQTYGDGEST